MKEGSPIRLIRACVEDTGILTSLLGWFDDERGSVVNHLADEKEPEEMYRLQGEARCIRRLRAAIAQMTKAKGAV
jgi:hypothetical protein